MGKQNKTILITGGAGFIGSNLLEYLFHKYPKYNFVVLDALTYAGDIKNISPEIHNSKRFRFVYGDVRNGKVVEHLVSQADAVIHLAAETHVARSIYDDSNFFTTDVLGTQCVANAVANNKKKVERFIHISTSEVYGTARSKKMDENHLLVPASPYAAAKAGADRLVEAYYITHRIPMVIIRPFNQFGPKQHLEKLIPRFITSAILNKPMTIHGTGNSQRDFTYVEDLARAIDLVLRAPKEKVEGQIFNVGAAKSHSINDIARMIIKFLRKKEQFKFNHSMMNIGERPGQVYRHTASHDKIKRVLGWQPKVSFEEGLNKTIGWYVDNHSWWQDKIWMQHVPIETSDGKIELH